jgi:formyl-CoA transferase
VRRIDETYEWDQTRSQGLVVEVDHATLDRISLPGPPVRFDGGGRRTHAAPPTLGQHDESVRAWLNEVDAKENGNAG